MAESINVVLPTWAIILIYSSLMILIVVENLAVILIVSLRKTMRSATNMYIVSLSVADLTVGAFVVISVLLETILPSGDGLWCYVSPFVELACVSASIMSLLAITVDRFRAVIISSSQKQNTASAKKVILAIWCFSFIYSCRIFVQSKITEYLSQKASLSNQSLAGNDNDIEIQETNDEGQFCNLFVEESTHDFVFRVIDFVILFVIPTCVMVFMYYKLVGKLWKQGIHLGPSVVRKRSVVKMLIADVTLFLVCWGPFYCMDIVTDSLELMGQTDGDEDTGAYTISRFVCILLALANSCLDPVVYAYFNTNFKSEVKILFISLTGRCGGQDDNIITDHPESSNSATLDGLRVTPSSESISTYGSKTIV